MPEPTSGPAEEGRVFPLRHPFLTAAAVVVLLLGGILLFARPKTGSSWPPVLYLSAADAAGNRWIFRREPGSPPESLSLSAMRLRSTTGVPGGTAPEFELTIAVYVPMEDQVRKRLREFSTWGETSRTYATKGETVERDGGRWYVLRPE